MNIIQIEIIKNYAEIIIIALMAMSFLLFFWNIMLQASLNKFKKRNAEFFSGNKIKNVDELILEHSKNLKSLDKDIQELFNISNQINLLSFLGLHKTGIVRFNPFKEVGGDQSFAIALLNGKDNGIIISSLYTREGTRIYAKTIKNGKSEKHPLTQEEEQAIKIAMQGEPIKIIS